MANTKLTVEQIMTRGQVEGFTAYQIHSIVNAMLEAQGRADLKIIPQMMYNYDRNGMIVKGTKNVTKTRTFTTAEVEEFTAKFVSNRIKKNPIQKIETSEIETVTEGHVFEKSELITL